MIIHLENKINLIIHNKVNLMKNTFLTLLLLAISSISFGQFVATMEVKEDIPGLCNKNGVYALMSILDGQKVAVCPVSKSEILIRLNSEVLFLQDNPDYKDKGMIGIIINCKGKVVKCEMDNNTKDAVLDKQIETVFNSLGNWKAGKLNGKKVDSIKLFSFKIRKGKFYWD